MTRKPKDKDIREFRERMQFLEMAWDCKTQYSVDLSTGKADLRVIMPQSSAALFVGGVDIRNVGIPGHDPDRGNDATPSAET